MAETSRMLLAHGGIQYDDEAIWGTEFQRRKLSGDFPWGKTPVLHVPVPSPDRPVVVAQSGAIARWSAGLAGCYNPVESPTQAAVADSVYELGQELCTINPLVNCYVGQDFSRIENYYFREVMPQALPQLEQQLERAASACAAYAPLMPGEVFFATTAASLTANEARYSGNTAVDQPTLADFNIFHHLDNAQLLEPDLLHGLPALQRWQERMLALPSLSQYLKQRPVLNGIGEDPGLEDRNGVRVTQRSEVGRAWLRDGLWCFDD
jgi:glutathione S-transferase